MDITHKSKEQKEIDTPSYEKLAKAAHLMMVRNRQLELEIGRLHMIVREMKKESDELKATIASLLSKINEDVEPNDL